MRDGTEAVVILRVNSAQPLRFTQFPGARIPLHATSTGKVLLAFSNDPEAEVAALGPLQRFTVATITVADSLYREFALIRERGYAINVAERVDGVCGVAAPVMAPDGGVAAAVAVQGPDIRMPEDRIDRLGPLLIDRAREIARMLAPAETGLSEQRSK
jgi:IclR family acetate operon transcriptional repressor